MPRPVRYFYHPGYNYGRCPPLPTTLHGVDDLGLTTASSDEIPCP